MNFLNPITDWQAQNLPEGLSISNGVISGTPTTAGAFKASVSVSNEFGSDTKNISFFVKYKPGTQKFSILQDGEEVAKVTIPELQTMVQDGTAQEQFNCTNTQIVLPVLTPELKIIDNSGRDANGDKILDFITRPSSLQDVVINFCSFRNVTLSDGSIRAGLILQFDKTLWAGYAPFDTGDTAGGNLFNRWRYSNLRQWLNAEGSSWFTPAYDGDALITRQAFFDANSKYNVYKGNWVSTYADSGSLGFLDLLPDDLHSILVPIKVVTQAYFDESNTNSSIEDPDDVDGYDADVTYDKVFIPSMKEMFIDGSYWDVPKEQRAALASEGVEGEPWEFYKHKMGTDDDEYIDDDGNRLPIYLSNADRLGWSAGYNSHFYFSEYNKKMNNLHFLQSWGDTLSRAFLASTYRMPLHEDAYNSYNLGKISQNMLTRTANSSATSGIGRCFIGDVSGGHKDMWDIFRTFNDNSPDYFSTYAIDANPAPAFVIC